MNNLIKQITIEENLFIHNEIIYEKLYNHYDNLKYRFFTENDYDYVENVEMINELDRVTYQKTFNDLVETIKSSVGEFNHNVDDKDKYFDIVLDFVYSEIVDDLI